MGLLLMTWMLMPVGTMVRRSMLVFTAFLSNAVIMFMGMFVTVRMLMFMTVLMLMRFIFVTVLMGMFVLMFVFVFVLVLMGMFAFHGALLSSQRLAMSMQIESKRGHGRIEQRP